jgi:D-beta-D-heptose 7-phosphate kinase/D-beta-D-heptose 1-phosphate adenosyltransferase
MGPLFNTDQSAVVLIVGDIILDRYVHGEASRISPEAPVPIVRVHTTEERPGGAGNVALNVSHVGIRTRLIGITGDDDSADILSRQLQDSNVECAFVRQTDFPTVTKLRILSQHQQLLRLDYEARSNNVDSHPLFELFEKQLSTAGIVILSDYAKGSLKNVEAFIQSARQRNIPVLVDPKSSDFSRYQGATLLTPNQKELEVVVGSCKTIEDIIEKGNALRETLHLEALLVTRGEHGMMLLSEGNEPLQLPAQAHEVFDVTGAGDTVIAIIAAAMVSGYDLVQATAFANLAAGLVVEKLGAASVSIDEINIAVQGDRSMPMGVQSQDQIGAVVREARQRNEKIVMTNGCFDILHAGHVSYLTSARQMGDRLLVAVNDDASVVRLKGQGRPIVPLEQRMAVLNALECVDWVVAFAEDTPERLICEMEPDVLVKGGDYRPDQIAGAECVEKKGGQVVILPLEDGCSTTAIIDSVKHADRNTG